MKTFKEFFLLMLLWIGGMALSMAAGGVLMALGGQWEWLDYAEVLRLMQWMQTIFMMCLPPVLWVKLVLKEPVGETLRLKRWPMPDIAMGAGVMLLLVPLSEWLGMLSYDLPWPESLRAWADTQMDAQGAMMGHILNLEGPVGFVRLALLIALATAIGEELMFRGALMRLIGTRYIHWAALLIGLAFALVHMELYGMVSRWALGALFVYLAYWTRSLWPAVAAHATNNLVALIEFKLDPEAAATSVPTQYFPGWAVCISTIGAAVLLIMMKRRSEHEEA